MNSNIIPYYDYILGQIINYLKQNYNYNNINISNNIINETILNYDNIQWSDTIPSKEHYLNSLNNILTNMGLKKLREERDQKLNDTDKYSFPDWPHPSDTVKQDWLTYRQALRDLPSTASPQLDANGNLTNVTWPTNPTQTVSSEEKELNKIEYIPVNNKLNENSIGLIVSSINKYNDLTTDNKDKALPIIDLSKVDNDIKVCGVILKKNTNGSLELNKSNKGSIWICNKNGILSNGDYVSSSSVQGYGMLQHTNKLLNSTVAKITCDCNFSLTKIVKQKIKLDSSTNIDYDANGDIQYVDDLDANGNQQMIYPLETRFLRADATQITETEYNTRLAAGEPVYIACFVGCIYHCG